MTSNRWRPRPLLTAMLAFIALGFGSNTARAQWGMGGMGWGLGLGFRNVPSPSDFLNQHALVRAGQGLQDVPSRTPYANNPNSYINKIRDNGFVSHADVRRRPTSYDPRPTASMLASDGGAGARPQAAPVAASVIAPPLSSFFDAALKLVWPNEAPTDGDLKEKRDLSDQASVAVLKETRGSSPASISSVTHARQKLIDYGQPALQKVRTESTPAISDTFHGFLLSLYDSLAQAAEPPNAIPPAPPIPR